MLFRTWPLAGTCLAATPRLATLVLATLVLGPGTRAVSAAEETDGSDLELECLDPGEDGDPKEREEPSSEVYHRFSIDLEIEGIPSPEVSQGSSGNVGAGGAVAPAWMLFPFTTRVDFTSLLERLGVAGVVDERSIRVRRADEPPTSPGEICQFLSDPQPRAKARRLLEGTSNRVSYVTEFPAGETPEGIRVAGELTWWVTSFDSPGRSRYRLSFGVLRDGHAIQVPYPPQNLRHFRDSGAATPTRWFPTLQIHPQWPHDGVLRILDGGKLLAEYHLGPRGATDHAQGSTAFSTAFPSTPHRPFVYPLIGPAGVSLTELGKPHDPTGSHAHHYSFWVAHGNVQGEDFWSERGGVIEHEGFNLLEDGPVYCRIVQRTRWVRGGKVLLRERRGLTFYTGMANPDFRLVDVELELSPPGNEPVALGPTTFGFLSVRVAQSMTVFDGGGEIVNSRGDLNEAGAHLSRAEWIDLSGPVAPGVWNGVAILDHPENPGHPTAWHCRNDGWACASFSKGRTFEIAPGSPLRLRYRVVLHRGRRGDQRRGDQRTDGRGPLAPRLVEAAWRTYAVGPRLTVRGLPTDAGP